MGKWADNAHEAAYRAACNATLQAAVRALLDVLPDHEKDDATFQAVELAKAALFLAAA